MDRIGEYSVSRLVGEGGMGRVYAAEERLSKRRVAVKLLRPELLRDDEGRRMFMSEMQILAQLEHPNIVRSLASLEHEGQPVLVLEYLEGKTLREVLNGGRPLPWARAIEIAMQVTSALVAAHEHEPPIVHRDLKPENVMVLADTDRSDAAEQATVKVMDFGIAKVLELSSPTGPSPRRVSRSASLRSGVRLEHVHGKSTHSLGTLQYMSPEQIDAKPVDARTDLYALGLLLYEMITGAPPFRSASPRELLNLQCTAEPPTFGEHTQVPAGLEELVFRLLAKSPDDRPTSAAAVLSSLAPHRIARRRDQPASSPSSIEPTEPRSTPELRAVTPTGTLRSTPTPRYQEAPSKKPREIRAWTGVAIVAAAAMISGGVTYGLRMHYTHAPTDQGTQQPESP